MSFTASSGSLDERLVVSFPDLFKGFLVQDAVVNPAYEITRKESEEWLRSTMSLTPHQQKRVNYCDFTFFCAVLVPSALPDKLKIVSDWGNWVFLFDDMFDEGELTNDPETARTIIDNLLSGMLPSISRESEEPVVLAHDSIFQRLTANSSPSTAARYIKAMESYCKGALQHVDDHVAKRTPSIQEMIETRRMSIGVFPMYSQIEFAYDLRLSDEVISHPTIQTLENLGAEFVMLMNDILSYKKEEIRENGDMMSPNLRLTPSTPSVSQSEECPFNMVAVCRINGMSAQEAFDHISSMIDERFALWDETVQRIPSWGEDIDAQVRRYVEGIQNIVQANLSWSFRTGRYFGRDAENVRASRQIDVLRRPGFLNVAGGEAGLQQRREHKLLMQPARMTGLLSAAFYAWGVEIRLRLTKVWRSLKRMVLSDEGKIHSA